MRATIAQTLAAAAAITAVWGSSHATAAPADHVTQSVGQTADTLPAGSLISFDVEEIGLSQLGAPILMVVICGQPPADRSVREVMVIAGQHGDEPAGPLAMLELVEAITQNPDSELADLLARVQLNIVPLANPDGAGSFERRAANGRDMNRDWQRQVLPETRALAAIVDRQSPDVLIDLHEETPRDRAGAYVEVGPGQGSHAIAGELRRCLRQQGIAVPVRTSKTCPRSALLHGHFASRYGRPSLLVESRYNGDPEEDLTSRMQLHRTAVMAVLRCLANGG